MRTLVCYLMLITLPLLGCRKSKSELEKLPPETQTGAETFSCLVNGKIFKPKGSPFGGPILSCAYQYINGGYYLQLSAKNSAADFVKGVSVNTDSLAIQQGQTILLETYGNVSAAAGQYSIIGNDFVFHEYLTSPAASGELHITRFDEINQIISGTFWFDAVNSNGEKVEVRQGRFDLHFTL